MAQIRQEINIIDVIEGTAGDGEAIVQLDTSKYNGTVTYYFESVAKVTSGTLTLTLQRVGTATSDATISVTATSYTRQRSASFSPPAGATEYNINLSGGTSPLVRAARIIVTQNATTITETETQIEIGNEETARTDTSDAVLAEPKYWYYDSSKWNGTLTVYAECTYKTTDSMYGTTIKVEEDDGAFGTWTDKVTIVSAGVATTPTRVRSASFTPTTGRNYRIVGFVANSMGGWNIYNAKIVVDQLGATTTATYYFDASQAGPTDAGAVWSNDANGFDGNTATFATSTSTSVGNTLDGTGTTAPTSGTPITQVRARVYGSHSNATATISAIILSGGVQVGNPFKTGNPADWGSYVVLDQPSGGWTWAKVNSLEAKWEIGGVAGTTSVAKAEIEVTYGDGATGFTLLEAQYLLANSGVVNTGLKDYDTLWDPGEWSGVTNTYIHEASSVSAGTSDHNLQSDPNGTPADITGSDITNCIQREQSTSLTMPGTSQDVDVQVVNYTPTNDLYASRILVQVSVDAAAAAAATYISTMLLKRVG